MNEGLCRCLRLSTYQEGIANLARNGRRVYMLEFVRTGAAIVTHLCKRSIEL